MDKMGEINLIIGCMFSGKSTEMIRIVNRYKKLENIKLLVINNKKDQRYGVNIISTHNKLQIDCISLDKLMSLKINMDFINSDVIFIEEAQFFPDLYSFCNFSANVLNKKLYVLGLNGDYLKRPFGDICRLIPECDTIKKLDAFCKYCNNGTPATFTKRIVDDNKLELIGVNEYVPVCRYHYLNKY